MNRRQRITPSRIDLDDEAGPSPSSLGTETSVGGVGGVGTKLEIKELDGRYDSRGNYTTSDSSVSILDRAHNPNDEFALVSTRIYGMLGHYSSTSLEVKSKLLKKALRKVIKHYPGLSLDQSHVQFEDPPKALVHYYANLRDYRTTASQDTKVHLDLLFKWLDAHMGSKIKNFNELSKKGLTSWPLAWMLFKPGTIVISESTPYTKAYIVKAIAQVKRQAGMCWELETLATSFNGQSFGRVTELLTITQYEGVRNIDTLKVFPLDKHSDPASVRAQLIARGQRFVDLRGFHHVQYKGLAEVVTQPNEDERYNHPSRHHQPRASTWRPQHIDGRVIIDAKIFCREHPSNDMNFAMEIEGPHCLCSVCKPTDDPLITEKSERAARSIIEDHETIKLTDKDLLLCPSHVLGFSLVSKKWARFSIDLISPVRLNSDAFEQLQVAETHKQLIQALVESHIDGEDSFDDVIAGKGKSLIILLYGSPGVGKTLTAESIADLTEKPLWSISSGELGTNPIHVEKNLTKILEIATAWKAVVLLDESDVFLQQRSQDVKRNALVSVFLRLLEYYQGILFLTSNRVQMFDTAFKSRIHVALNYPDLTPEIRERIWKGFIERVPVDMCDVLPIEYPKLAAHEINGRQIKNAVKNALALAKKRGEKLSTSHLNTTLATMIAFELDCSIGA